MHYGYFVKWVRKGRVSSCGDHATNRTLIVTPNKEGNNSDQTMTYPIHTSIESEIDGDDCNKYTYM